MRDGFFEKGDRVRHTPSSAAYVVELQKGEDVLVWHEVPLPNDPRGASGKRYEAFPAAELRMEAAPC